jgi:hypothetical protein
MKEKSDWKRITLLRKTSFKKRLKILAADKRQTGMYGPPLRRKRNVRMSQVGLRKCIRPLLE